MKIDWTAAKKDYLTDPQLSYEDIAKKYKVSTKTIAIKAGKEDWVNKRKELTSNIQEKVIEKAGDKIAEFQAQKLKVGTLLISKGVQAFQDGKMTPKTARESKELIETGYKIASEAMGVDKPGTQINIQNNFLSITDFIADIVKRREANG